MLSLLAALAAFLQPTPASPAQAQSCQAALGPLSDGMEEAALPNPVDGAAIRGREGLAALRVAHGDALITVRGGSFARADLRGARLHNICFLDTDFAGSDWRGAEAAGVGFVRVDLTGADLTGAHMERVLFRKTVLERTRAESAMLAGGRLDGGWFDNKVDGLVLDGANLRGFRFDCGIAYYDACLVYTGPASPTLRGADLTGADLTGANFLWRADSTGARIDRTRVELDQLGALRAADISGPILVGEGDSAVELSPADHAALLPHIRRGDGADAPSFDCARASGGVERMICGDRDGRLRALDALVADLYRRARDRHPGVEVAQREWLRERDGCVADVAAHYCVEASYDRRKAQLIGLLGAPPWAGPGVYARFIGPSIEVDDGFRDDPLYHRLLPALVGQSWMHLFVRFNDDGTISARGSAIGPNAHECGLWGDKLSLDRSTGWFSGPYEAEPDDPAEGRDRPMPVLLLWDDRAEIYRDGRSPPGPETGDPVISPYVGCGMRAGFGQMLRVPISPEEGAWRFGDMEDVAD